MATLPFWTRSVSLASTFSLVEKKGAILFILLICISGYINRHLSQISTLIQREENGGKPVLQAPFKKKTKNPKTNQCIEDRNILQTLQNMWTAIKIILCVAPELGHFNLPYPDCMIQASHPSLFPAFPILAEDIICDFSVQEKLCSVLLFFSSWSTFSAIPPFIPPAIHLERVPCLDRNKTELARFLVASFSGF